jgi:hypothetical protein
MGKKRELPTVSAGFDISDIAYISHEEWDTGGRYTALKNGTTEEMAYLAYAKPLDDPWLIRVINTTTHPDYQGQKVMTALVDRMAVDHPEYFVDVGAKPEDNLPSSPGGPFYEFLKANLPYFTNTVISEGARDN